MTHRAFAVLAVLILAGFGIALGARLPAAGSSRRRTPSPCAASRVSRSKSDTDQGAGRVSFIHGDVSMQRSADSGDESPVTSAVTLNTPLVAGDRISTGDASRTELQLDFANVLRLDERAQANIAALTRSRIQIQLAQGLANYSVLKGSEADIEIDTPNVSVHPQREGRYRILVNGDGETEVVVRDGQADVSTPQGSTQVHKGEQITIQGVGNDAQYRVTSAPGNDDWDRWNSDRDHIITNAGRPTSTPARITPVDRISIPTEFGAKSPTTAKSGRRRWRPVGRRTARAAGSMSRTGDGLGSPMNLGAGHRITMAAGSSMVVAGPGGPVPLTSGTVRSGRQRTFPSSDSGEELASASALVWASGSAMSVGWRPGLAISSTRGGVASAAALEPWTFTTITMLAAASRHCTTVVSRTSATWPPATGCVLECPACRLAASALARKRRAA